MFPDTSRAWVGVTVPIPRQELVLSQCKLVGVRTGDVPLPTRSLLVVSVLVPVPPADTRTVPRRAAAVRLAMFEPSPVKLVAFTVPVTSRACEGVVVPIPTLHDVI